MQTYKLKDCQQSDRMSCLEELCLSKMCRTSAGLAGPNCLKKASAWCVWAAENGTVLRMLLRGHKCPVVALFAVGRARATPDDDVKRIGIGQGLPNAVPVVQRAVSSEDLPLTGCHRVINVRALGSVKMAAEPASLWVRIASNYFLQRYPKACRNPAL